MYMKKQILLMFALLLAVTQAMAFVVTPGVVTVGTTGDYTDLQSAITNAATGDEIHIITPGTYSGVVLNSAKNLVVLNQASGTVTVQGASPALTVSSGFISFNGVNFITATNDPTILITGGKLELRNCVVTETPGFNQAGVYLSGGELDAGTLNTPGHNSFVVSGAGYAVKNMAGIANAIRNYWGSEFYMNIAPLINGTVAWDPWCNSTFTNCNLSVYGGPITTIPKIIIPCGSSTTVDVPVYADQFANIDAISLTIDYFPGTIQYTGFTPGAAFVGMNVIANNLTGKAVVGWFGAMVATWPNNVPLVTLHFNYSGGSSYLNFNDANVVDCEYQNALIQYPYADEVYNNGWVTDLGGMVVSSTNVICYGTPSGTITISNASCGSGVYEYSVDGGATWQSGNTFSVYAGTYDVWIRDANFPMVKIQLNPALIISQPTAPFSLTAYWTKRVRCKGESNGEATAFPVGGWGGYTYLWNDPMAQTTAKAVGLASGWYTVKVTDAGGCSITLPVNVIEPVLPFQASVSPLPVSCKGSATGGFTVTAANGWGYYMYSIDMINYYSYLTSNTVTGLPAGNYTVHIFDDERCELFLPLNIPEPAIALTGNAAVTQNVSCYGFSDGIITASASGGWGLYQYSKDGGATWQNSPVFNGLVAGSYTIKVKDLYNCIITLPPVLVTQPPYFGTTLSGNNTICYGFSTPLTFTSTGGVAPYTLTYTDGTSNFVVYPVNSFPVVINVSPASSTNYTLVSVTDANGCPSLLAGNAAVTVNPLPVVTDVTLTTSVDQTNWGSVGGTFAGGYTLCIDPVIPYHYLDINTFTVGLNGLMTGSFTQNAFYLNTGSVPGNFYAYWAAKGVVSGASGWQGIMWNIINGTAPMFYVNYNGVDYTLVDGLQWQAAAMVTTLRISGDYPQGNYIFNGTVTDVNGCVSLPFNISLQLNSSPVVTDVTLSTSVDNLNWSSVAGTFNSGYTMCIDPVIPYHYMDINTLTVGINPLLTGSFTQNAFFLNITSLPVNFYSYWAAKGVVSGATGWQGVMWNIINGAAPMFYINYNGVDYTLVDGLQYQVGSVVNPLRISGDYPQGNYTFTGTVTDLNGCASSPFSVNLQLNSSPVVTDVTLLTSVDQSTWGTVGGSFTGGYTMCIDPTIPYHYMDINTLTVGVNSLMTSSFTQNSFFLNPSSVPANFYAYWAAKGVVSGASGWQGVMWNIINGNAPMFYINYDGSGYSLVDGLQYQVGAGVQTLRISGDYPQGNYMFTGTVTDVNGCVSSQFSITLQMNSSPVVTDVALQESEDMTTWNSVAGTLGTGYSICLNSMAQFHYLDINTMTVGVNGLLQNSFVQNAFYLDATSVPAGFFAYWAAKGVVSGATGWQGVMWNIINGAAPMLYIKYNGTDYTLIDGLQYQAGAVESTLRISGDYPTGNYLFKGTVTDANGCQSSPFTINMTFNHKPLISFGFNGVEAGHNAVFNYCYNEAVGVTLFNIYDGVAPFSVTYEVNGVPATVTGLNLGGIILPSQILAPGTYNVVVTNITDANGCNASAAFLALCQATVFIHDEPIISFGFNGVEAGHNAAFEYCYDQPVGVTLYAQYGGTAPYSVTYTVNGGTPVTVTGLSVGSAIIAPQIYAAGTYNIVVTNITDVYGCVASPAFLAMCQATVVINPEPAVGFSFNGVLAVTGSIFDYCYTTPVNVTLSHIWSGYAPFNVTFTVDDGSGPVTSTVSGLMLNGSLFSGLLAPGSYLIKVTNIVDAKGCSPSSYQPYTATVNIHKVDLDGVYTYHNAANTPLNNITVNINGPAGNYTAVTDQNGYYKFQGICPGTYEVISTTIKPVGSINSTDAVQVNTWGVNYATDPIEKVRFKAGDVAPNFGFVDMGDAISILSYFVAGGNPAFNPNWVFWQTNDATQSNPTILTQNPFVTLGFTDLTQDFYGMVSADFNRSFTPGNAKIGTTLSLNHNGSVMVEKGQELLIPVTAASAMNITAASLIMNYPSDKIEILGVNLAGSNNPVMFNAANGNFRIGYADMNPITLNTGDVLFTIRVRASQALAQGEKIMITLTADPLNELADETYVPIPGAVLNIPVIESTTGMNDIPSEGMITLTNRPNPFNGVTQLYYLIPASGNVEISLFDLYGRQISSIENSVMNAGQHNTVLDISHLSSGVYMVMLKYSDGTSEQVRSLRIVNQR
jgi:hypothetical protein